MPDPIGPKGPTPNVDLSSTLRNLKADQISSLMRLGTRPTDDPRFGQLFAENPAAALAAKGIVISDVEATRIRERVTAVRGSNAATEVEVTVKIKF